MRKLFSLFAALTLSVGLWAETVSFLYPVYKTDGDPTSGIKEWKTIDVYAATELTPDLIQDGKITLGQGVSSQEEEFYSVSYNKDWDGSCEIICNGKIGIFLKGDANLNVAKITLQNDGIYGSGLSIYAQSTSSQMGSLTVREGINGAYSGVYIYGGKITVEGQGGGTPFPGIGGFNTTVVIDGGEVTATGYGIGAGIGGSADETALSSFEMGTFYNVIINGGTVTATGGHEGGAGIGGDALSMHTFTLINGGQITATGGDGNDNGGSGIGYGEGALGARVFVATSLRVKAGDTENPTTEIAPFRSDFEDIASELAGKKYATIEPKPLPIRTTYVNEMGEVQEVDAWEVKDASEVVTWGAQGPFPTFYVVNGDITLSKGAVCNGIVNLILADGAKLTVNGEDNKAGIKESGEGNEDILIIYGQAAQTGQLIATGGTNGAGIGGGNEQNGARIIFNGGKVTANGGTDASGIGGGKNGNTFSIAAATFLKVKAGDSENPTTEVASDRDPSFPDISTALAGKRYVVIEPKPKADLTLEDFVVSDNSVPYNGYARGANVYFKEGIIGAGTMTVTYKQSGEVVTPINLGEYDIHVSVAAGLSYNAFDAAKVGTLTINKATPSAANFTFVAPEDLVYDGNTKTATVTFNTQNGKLSGMGTITVKYNGSTDAPSAAGDYTVSIDVAEGTNFTSITSLTDAKWTFSIIAPISTAYIDENGQSQVIDALPVLNAAEPVTWGTADETTWFVVNGTNVQLAKGAICAGDVRLILADNALLTTTGAKFSAGIKVSGEGNSLTIYAQSTGEQMGQLIATAGSWSAGIGGGDNGSGSNITINGGKITATGNSAGAGIGGGDNGSASDITINGGIVTAKGGSEGAGIGGGDDGSGSNITINGGTVTATGGNTAAGIGGGDYGFGSNITINGGTITANGGSMAAGIGGGRYGTGSNIFVATDLVVKADGNNPPTTVIAATRTATTDIANDLAGKQYATIEPKPLPVSTSYLDENGVEQNISAWEVKDASDAVTWGTADETTWFVVNGTNVQLAKGAVCAGDVRLILADGAKLTTTGSDAPGIKVSGDVNSLTIYGQTAQSGQLFANSGGFWSAGIGGGMYGVGSNITINGGKVTAQGGGAGIGGGEGAAGSNIIINGGIVIAQGESGIGGGYNSPVSNNIYISDAYVLKAGTDADNTEVIDHSSATDLGSTLNKKKYVKIEGLATPYTRTTSVDQWATVCLPYDATSFSGADFYKVNYYDGVDKLYIEPVDNLLAGVPYIFHTTATTVTIEHNATAPEAVTAGDENGLYGSFARKTIAYDADHAFAALANNTVNVIEEGHTVTVPACRAYLDMDQVPTSEQPHSAPLRCIGVPRQNPTSLGGEADRLRDRKVIKVVENGQFRIVREGKTYNAQGIEL